jgi:hypothetical protein
LVSKTHGTSADGGNRAAATSDSRDSKKKYCLLVTFQGKRHYVIHEYEILPLNSDTLEDQHFLAPEKECPMWWHSEGGAKTKGMHLKADFRWDDVEIVKYRIPDRHVCLLKPEPLDIAAFSLS